MGRLRIGILAVVFALSCSAVAYLIGPEVRGFTLLSEERMGTTRVGAVADHCCKWGLFVDCTNKRPFTCRPTAQVQCITSDPAIQSTCDVSTCEASSGHQCDIALNAKTIKFCQIGTITTTGCPMGESKCQVAGTTTQSMLFDFCRSTSDFCSPQLPTYCSP